MRSVGPSAPTLESGSFMNEIPVKVLLVEDDNDDYVLTADLLSEVKHQKFQLDWVTTYDEGLKTILEGRHDICLLDYRLGERNGLELLGEVVREGCRMPIIFLTGYGDYEVDYGAMRAGAADYLVKGEISPPLLGRSIRYALEHRRVEDALRESERQLRRLASQLLEIQENERKRIAKELHDSVGQSLTAIKFSVEHIMDQMEKGLETAGSLRLLISMTQSAIEEMHNVVADLRPSLLDDAGILSTIKWFCSEFQKTYKKIRIRKELKAEECDIHEPLKIVIFRIVQEALNNVAKHSGADSVLISLVKTEKGIELTIRDNGTGFDPVAVFSQQYSSKGFGLSNMRERAKLSGGGFTIESSRGAGTAIIAFWPD